MNKKVLERSVTKARKLMNNLTPLDTKYIDKYIASCGLSSPNVIKGNADDIIVDLRRCAQDDMFDGFNDVIELDIFHDPITYSNLEPPYAERPMVRLKLLNPNRGVFRPHVIFRLQDEYILITH